ncbi:MAG: hypothetical protein OWQ48_05185 [Desulfurococcus sp.]|nr:hypothetical protein [Desulfurococcus sp.]
MREISRLAFFLIITGIIFVAIGSLAIALEAAFSSGSSTVSTGGCIIVFFIPICFGSGTYGNILLLASIVLSIILTLILLVLSVIHAKTPREPPAMLSR